MLKSGLNTWNQWAERDDHSQLFYFDCPGHLPASCLTHCSVTWANASSLVWSTSIKSWLIYLPTCHANRLLPGSASTNAHAISSRERQETTNQLHTERRNFRDNSVQLSYFRDESIKTQKRKDFLQVTQNTTGTKSGPLEFETYQENIWAEQSISIPFGLPGSL